MNTANSARITFGSKMARERVRRRYRPAQVRLLFVGEAPPASGRYFYQANSGLYRAIREAFVSALPCLPASTFLEQFRHLGCYLIDLCEEPVDQLNQQQRREAHRGGVVRLSTALKQLRPELVITVVRSIAPIVKRAQEQADWAGLHLELPYPGRWSRYRTAFLRDLVPVLQQRFVPETVQCSSAMNK